MTSERLYVWAWGYRAPAHRSYAAWWRSNMAITVSTTVAVMWKTPMRFPCTGYP